jgi:hypothetical protein
LIEDSLLDFSFELWIAASAEDYSHPNIRHGAHQAMGQMSAAVERDEYRDELRGGKYPPLLRAEVSEGGGSGMEDDILKRLGVVESSVSEIRTQVGGITATLPHLATKADLSREIGGVRAEINSLRVELVAEIGSVRSELGAEIGSVRSELGAQIGSARSELGAEIGSARSELGAEIGSLRTHMASEFGSVRAEIGSLKVDLTEKIGLLENRLVRWIIGIIIAAAGLAFTIGRYGH